MSAPTTALPPSCSASPSWEVAAHQERVALERGMREWMLVEFNGRAAIYWITPKAAHALIVRLFRKKPWSMNTTNPGHAGVGGQSFMGQRDGSISRRRAAKELQQARRRHPLEFTFVREPLQQLISSAAQLHSCIKEIECFNTRVRKSAWWGSDPSIREACAAITAEGHMDTARRVLRLMNMSMGHEAPTCHVDCAPFSERKRNMRRCSRHIWPQTAGYGFDDQGARRLQFVGRIERFREDWERLLTVLSDDANHTTFRKLVTRKVNRRPHPAALGKGGSEWSKLRQEPLVRTWLHSMVKVGIAPWQCSSPAYCATSGRTWWSWAAPRSQGEASPLGAQPLVASGARASRLQSRRFHRVWDHPGSGTTTAASTTRGRGLLSRSSRRSTGRRRSNEVLCVRLYLTSFRDVIPNSRVVSVCEI